jgi:hypothetical protein
LRRLVALLLLAGMLGCDSKPSPSPSAPSAPVATIPAESASGRIRPEDGGSVGDPAGACVTVPPGAVDREVRIQLATKPADDFRSAGTRVVGRVWTFEVDGQEHFTFGKPVRLALPIDPALMAQDAPVALSVWTEGAWRSVQGARVEADSRRIVAEVDHFSAFAPTQDVVGSILEQDRRRFLENEFWYCRVHLAIRGSGRSGADSYTISREANIKARFRVDPGELATFSGFDELKKRGVKLPGDGEANVEKLRNFRVWSLPRQNRAPEDEIDVDWSVNDRAHGPSTAKSVAGQYAGKSMADFVGDAKLVIDVLKGTYSVGFGIQRAGTITSIEGKNGVPKSAPGEVMWTRQGELPASGNVLTGRILGPTLAANIGNGGVWAFNYGSVRATMTWTLSPKPLEDVELVLVPDKEYDDWMPAGGQDEEVAGSTIGFTAALRRRGGGATAATMTELTVRLPEVSREPGVCLNLPPGRGATSPDLKFAPAAGASIDEEGTRLRKKGGKFTEYKVTVNCYDWGAWGAVAAEAWLSDGRVVWASLDGDPSEPQLRLPKRDATSKVADAWKKKMGVEGRKDDEDADKQPGNQQDGDGLTLYEEYRGLIARGTLKTSKHTREHPAGLDGVKPLTPGVKDLIVHNTMEEAKKPHELLPAVRKGLVQFQEKSGVHVVEVREAELPDSRQVNVNLGRTTSAGPQYGLRMFDDPALPTPGATEGGGGKLRGPDLTRSPMGFPTVKLNLKLIKSNHEEIVRACRKMKIAIPHTLEESAINTAAHELAHGLGVRHHGEDRAVTLVDPQRLKWYDRDGTPVPAPASVANVGEPGNTSSGDVNCIMCYNNVWTWSWHSGTGVYAAPVIADGKIFCTSNAATGPNAPRTMQGGMTLPGVFGKALAGNCLGQMRVKDQTR